VPFATKEHNSTPCLPTTTVKLDKYGSVQFALQSKNSATPIQKMSIP